MLVGLLDPGERGQPGARTFVPMNAIEAVTLHGYGPDEPTESAPGMLQFRRSIAEWQGKLSAAFGCEIAVTGDFQTGDLAALEALRRTLAPIASDFAAEPAAKEAFSERVKEIELGVAPEASVELVSGKLRVLTTAKIPDRMRPEDLKRAIESKL